jgi:hypothetical protein
VFLSILCVIAGAEDGTSEPRRYPRAVLLSIISGTGRWLLWQLGSSWPVSTYSKKWSPGYVVQAVRLGAATGCCPVFPDGKVMCGAEIGGEADEVPFVPGTHRVTLLN